VRILSAAIAVVLAATPLGAAVTVSTITPECGLTRGGEIVHIHGTGLNASALACPEAHCGTYVRFGSVDAAILDDTASDLVVLAPPHSAGAVDVEVHIGGSPSMMLPSAYDYETPADADQVRLLIPIAISGAGALGTSWKSELVAYNGNAGTLTFGDTGVPPFSSSTLTLAPPAGNSGVFVYVPKSLVDHTTLNLRVHDTTHDAGGWGVEIPVVAETQFRNQVVLTGIPNDGRFRTLLRIYSFSSEPGQAMVTLRDDATGVLLDARTVSLQGGHAPVPGEAPDAPAYAQLSFDSFDAAHTRLRAEVTAADRNAPPLWAFVSITNNVTQQVTTVSPAVTATAVSIPTEDALPLGNWNAGSAGCAMVTSVDVSIAAGCTLTTFSYPALGADHRFEADGHTISTAGPSHIGDQGVEAHISGVLQGDTLTIVIRTSTTTFAPITFQLGTGPRCGFPCV
jgi:hypothetical protein